MTLRLNDADTEALRRRAAAEGRSMQAVARDAILDYVYDRPARLRALVDEISVSRHEHPHEPPRRPDGEPSP